ncbi:unnamed protein product [Mucor circinelloides]
MALDNDVGPNRKTVPSTFEKMPGTYDFDAASSDMTSSQRSMTSPATTPVFLKNPSFRDIPASPNARQNEKEPALDPPSPLPQMNDAAVKSGLKPISSKNLNGDDGKPNNAHENDTYRSNVLDSLRNAAMDNTEIDDNHSKEREILFEDESHEHVVPTASTRGITSNTNNALEDSGVNNSKPDAIIPRSSNKQSSDTDSKFEPQPATSGPSDMDAEKAIAPLAASVATVAAATATAAIALSNIDKDDSHPASPLETAIDETHAPKTFQGDLGYNGTEPFNENAEDTELMPEVQPSSAKWNKLNVNDAESSGYMNTAIADARSLSPKSSDFNQFENKKPFQRETFQGGLGGNGTEPYIKNEKDTLLKPEDQPSFGAQQGRLQYANDETIEPNDMEQPNVSKASINKDSPYVPEFFQGGLGGNGTEAYIQNEKDTWLRSEDKPSFDAEQKKPRKLNGFDTENEEVGVLKNTDQEIESSPSLGTTLSKIGAGAAGVAGAAALGLSEHNDSEKDKDGSIDLAPSNDASDHSLTSPRNVYSPSLTSGNSLENTNHTDVISDEALSDIADKIEEDVKHNDLKDNSATIGKDGVVSSDASDKIADNLDAALKENAVPTSTSLDVSPQEDINVLVDRDTSLPPNIDNEVDIETKNNGSNRSPLVGKTTTPPTVLDSNDNANTTPGLNSAYTGGSSAIPDSVYRAAPALDNDKTGFKSHIPATPAVNTSDVSPTSHSLNSNDAIKDDCPRESSKDDTNNKEDKPGFFKRLLRSRSRSPEPTSRSISATSDKASSKGTASPTAESRDSSKSADAPIVAKFDVSQENAPAAALNTTGNLAGSDNALEGISPDVHDADISLNTPQINASAPSAIFSSSIETPAVDFSNADSKLDKSLDPRSIDNGFNSPGFNANVNVDASGLSNSLGNMSAGIKGLGDNVSSKFDGSVDSPTVGGNLPSASFPNADGKLGGSLEAPDIDAKLPSIDSDLKSPRFNTDIHADHSDLSGSLPKISSGFRNFKDNVDDKFNGSIDTPDIDGKLLSLNAKLSGVDGGLPISDSDMAAPKLDMPSFDGKLTGYIDPPSVDGNVPSVDTDIKSPNVDLPNVSGKLDRSISTPDVNDDLKSPGVDATIDRPDLSNSLGKLSSSFKGLKDSISDKFNGSVDTPDVGGKSPSLNAKLSGVDGGLPISDSDMAAPKLDMPSFDGKLTGYIDPPSVDGNVPSVDTDIKSPSIDLPNVSGKLDRSISAPYNDSNMKISGFNANANVDTSGVSASLDKLSAGLKNIKYDISTKFDDSVQSTNIDGELPTVGTNLKGSSMELPNADGKLDGSIQEPDFGGKLSSLDTDLKGSNIDVSHGKHDGSLNADLQSPKASLPNVSGNLDKSIGTPKIDTKLPSVDGKLESHKVDADANADAGSSSLSGALGKLSSGFKGLKDEITGVFSGSADASKVDNELPSANTDYCSPKFGLPDADLELDGSVDTPNVSGDLPFADGELKTPSPSLSDGNINLNSSINTPGMNAKLPHLDTNLDEGDSDKLPSTSESRGFDSSVAAPKADVDVPDMHTPNLDASADGNISTAFVAPPRRIELSGSLGKVNAGLTTPKTDVDVPQVAADNDSPVAPPRSPRLSLNKLSSKTSLDSSVKSSNMDVDVPETSSGFKSPSFNVHVNGKPALAGDLSTGLHRSASAEASGSGSITADKADGEGSSSFFSKPIEKINGAVGNYDDNQTSEDDETHDGKTSTGYATLRTRSRNESPDNLSAMLDDIVKRRFSNTPSESDVSSVVSDKKANKKESASHKSRNLDASANLNTGVSQPHASLDGDRPRSTVSDSRFKELDEQEGEVTGYSTPLTSPVLTKEAPSAAVTAPTVTLDKIDGLESDVEKQLDAMSVSVGEAPQVPAHEEDSLPSPSRTHRSSISLQSTSFHDRSAADAIKSVYDNMTSKLMTGGPKSGNGTDDRVLKVRDGFENFNGFGVKCVSDNEDEEKHTAPSSALK